jgi:HJR/Mrr/RecB family endonuclease
MAFFNLFPRKTSGTTRKKALESTDINTLLAPNGNVPSDELLSELLNFQDLSGEAFEELLARLLRNAGYHVKLTKKSYDYGIDLIVSRHEKEEPLYLIQAKKRRHKHRQEFITRSMLENSAAGKEVYQAPNAQICFITTSYFDEAALRFAAKANIMTINFKDLFIFISKHNPAIIYNRYIELSNQQLPATAQANNPAKGTQKKKSTCTCENCGNVLAVKKGKNATYFLGCANYEKESKRAYTLPKCKNCGTALRLTKFRYNQQYAFICPNNKESAQCKANIIYITNT